VRASAEFLDFCERSETTLLELAGSRRRVVGKSVARTGSRELNGLVDGAVGFECVNHCEFHQETREKRRA